MSTRTRQRQQCLSEQTPQTPAQSTPASPDNSFLLDQLTGPSESSAAGFLDTLDTAESTGLSSFSSTGSLGGGIGGGMASGMTADAPFDHRREPTWVDATPFGPMVRGVQDLGSLAELVHSNETADQVASTGGNVANVVDGASAFAEAAGKNVPGTGPVGGILSALGAYSDVRDLQTEGNDPRTMLSLASNTAGVVSTFLPPQAQAVIAAANAGISTGNLLVDSTESVAQSYTGPDADRRGLTSRLADRGGRMDAWVDEVTGNDTAGDVLGGIGTVGQMLVPGVLHYDVVDSYTGGGLSNAVENGRNQVSDAWNSFSLFD